MVNTKWTNQFNAFISNKIVRQCELISFIFTEEIDLHQSLIQQQWTRVSSKYSVLYFRKHWITVGMCLSGHRLYPHAVRKYRTLTRDTQTVPWQETFLLSNSTVVLRWKINNCCCTNKPSLNVHFHDFYICKLIAHLSTFFSLFSEGNWLASIKTLSNSHLNNSTFFSRLPLPLSRKRKT